MTTTIVLPGERSISWNKYYSGMHWILRSKEAKRVKQLVRAAFTREQLDQGTYTAPVDIVVHAYFGSRPQDADNVCTKLYVDALKGWIIEDDDPAHVTSVVPMVSVDRDNPRVELIIREAQDGEPVD